MYDENLFAVDTTGTQEMGGYEVLPAGLYPAIMVSASKKPTKKGDGAFLECVYQLIDGEMTGKKFTSRLNLWNTNAEAVDIAKRELKSLRVALGLHDTEARTEAFINRPVVLNITVKPRKDKPTEPENNLIAIEGYTGAPAQVRPAPAAAPHQHVPQQQYGAPAQNVAGYAPQAPQPIPQQYAPQPLQQQPQQQYTPAPAYQHGAVAPQQPPMQAPAPAFQPQPGKPAPWLTPSR